MEGFQIHIYIYIIWSNVTPGSRNILSFHIFEPYQSSKNKIKQLKKQWTTMKPWWKKVKTNETNMTNTTKTMKHTEKKSTQWKASKYIIWSHVTPGSRKYSIFPFFCIFKPYQSSKITLNNWKTLKNNLK